MKVISVLLGFCFVIALCAAHGASAYTPPSLPPPTKTVHEIIAANKKLSKFTSMIDEAGLKDMLSANTGEPVTVFASTDEALENAPRDVMKRIEGNKSNLQSFVKYHIIAGSMVSSGAIKGRRSAPATANGESLPFDGMEQKNLKVGDGTLIQADIMATNGIIHVVSTALIPPSLSLAPAPLPPAQPVAPTPPVAATGPSPAQPNAPSTSSAVRITTTGVAKSPLATNGAITTNSTASSITTSGVAKAPAPAMETVTTGSAAAVITTTSGMLPLPAVTSSLPVVTPSPLPQSTSGSSKSFELWGHKFGW